MSPHIKRRSLFLILAFIVIIVAVGLALPARDALPPTAPVEIYSRPYTISSPKVGLLDRVIPRGPSWVWLWRLRYALFGKNIDLDSTIIDCTGSDLATLATVLPAKPDFVGSDGVQVWRLKEADLQVLRKYLKQKPGQIVNSPRVTAGDNTERRLFCGSSALINGSQQPVGLSLDLLPCLRKATNDLTVVVRFSETVTNLAAATPDAPYVSTVSIQTNLDFAGRFQLPWEMPGVFVLPAAGATNQTRIALLLTSKVQQPKK